MITLVDTCCTRVCGISPRAKLERPLQSVSRVTPRVLPLLFAIGCDGGLGAEREDAAMSPDGGDSIDAEARPQDAAEGTDAAPTPGLRGEYFAGYDVLVLERIDPNVDFAWGSSAPAPEVGEDRFSARWTGHLAAPADGTYRFATVADDGVRLWVGDQLVIDDWTFHYLERREGTVELSGAAPVPLRLEYVEADLTAEAHLSWSGPTIVEEVIPTAALSASAQSSGIGAPLPPYANPVVPFDCPDPGVIAADGLFYMVCTGGTFPIRRSRDLVRWEDTGAAILPEGKPAWAANGWRNWAPEIHRVGDRWVAYFTTVNGDDRLCIGAAVADGVLGPWADRGGPLVEDEVGVIDATFFEDGDGRRYLFYKIDGNSRGQPTPIFARELTQDGLSFAGGSAPVQVLVNDPASWEGGVVEAPWVALRDGSYFLFYSGEVYDYRYRTGVARAASVLGPYEKRGAPILVNNERWVGPGHGSVVRAGENDYFFYHAWVANDSGTNDPATGRQGLVDRIDWVDGWPRIHDGSPSRSLEPPPGTGYGDPGG